MKLKLHHINLATENVPRMDSFYRDVLGLSTPEDGLPTLEKKQGYAGDVSFLHDGDIQTHLAQRDMLAGFATGQIVNPVATGHTSPIARMIWRSSKPTSTHRASPIRTGANVPSQAGTKSSSTTQTAMSSKCTRSIPETDPLLFLG